MRGARFRGEDAAMREYPWLPRLATSKGCLVDTAHDGALALLEGDLKRAHENLRATAERLQREAQRLEGEVQRRHAA